MVKAFADRSNMIELVSCSVEKLWVERRKCWLAALSCFSTIFSKVYLPRIFSPLPHMPILGSSNSAANKDMMSKYGQMGIHLSDRVENIVGKGAISSFSSMFSKTVCC